MDLASLYQRKASLQGVSSGRGPSQTNPMRTGTQDSAGKPATAHQVGSVPASKTLDMLPQPKDDSLATAAARSQNVQNKALVQFSSRIQSAAEKDRKVKFSSFQEALQTKTYDHHASKTDLKAGQSGLAAAAQQMSKLEPRKSWKIFSFDKRKDSAPDRLSDMVSQAQGRPGA